MSATTCPKCGTAVTPTMLACPNCATLLFDPHVSTVNMRIDPGLMRLRRNRDQNQAGPLNEHMIVLQIRGMMERLIFEEGTEIVLGRSDMTYPPSNRLDLTMYGGLERGVSREHALLRLQDGKLTITDLNSVNGTTVNLKKMKPNESWPIYNGDSLMLGNLSLTIRFEPVSPGTRTLESSESDKSDK